jgi:exopolysaccharide biosynthesis protein
VISAVGFIPVLMLICHIVLLPLSPVAMAVESDPLSSDDASIVVPVLDDQVKAEQKTSTSDRPLESCEIAPGVSLVKQHRIESYGPVAVNILAVTPTPQVSLSIGLATRGSLGLEPLSAIAEREGALAAVNGTFFHWSGLPLGLLVDRGVLISAPVYERTTLVMLTDGSGGLDRVLLRIWLQLADGTRLPVHGVNRQAKSGECVIYNTAFARETPSFAPEQELVLRDGIVIGRAYGGTPLAPGTVVVAGDPTGRLRMLEVGEHCRVAWEIHLSEAKVTIPGECVWFALGGGPRLVTRANITVTSDREQFRSDVTQGRAPRTAIGFTAEGTLLLVTVDGRQPSVSVGMTLEELAALMVELGAVEAMNLDGGGSTTMVVRDNVVNMPSNGVERALSSALLIMVEAAEAADALEAATVTCQ